MIGGGRHVLDAVGSAKLSELRAGELGPVVADQGDGTAQSCEETTQDGDRCRGGDSAHLDHLRPLGEGVDNDEVVVTFERPGEVDVHSLPRTSCFRPRHWWSVWR